MQVLVPVVYRMLTIFFSVAKKIFFWCVEKFFLVHHFYVNDALCLCSRCIVCMFTTHYACVYVTSYLGFMPGWSYLDVFYLYQAINDCINGQTRNGVYAEFTANVSSVGHNGVY